MYDQVGAMKPFYHFDLSLTSHQITALQNLQIERTAHYDNYGDLQNLPMETNDFITSLGQNYNCANAISTLIVAIVRGMLTKCNQEKAWVTLRAFEPNPIFIKPRWHTDGYYYSPQEGEQHKIAITLKGPATLFAQLPQENRIVFNRLQLADNQEDIDILMKSVPISTAKPYEGTIFIVGAEYAAIHSEPNINEPRLFLSVLPGNAAQIAQWAG